MPLNRTILISKCLHDHSGAPDTMKAWWNDVRLVILFKEF